MKNKMNTLKPKILNTHSIIASVAAVTGKPYRVITGSSRVASIVAARNLCYKIAKEHLYLADRDIASSFNRDRSAVTYSLKRVEQDLIERNSYRMTLEVVKEVLGL